MAEATKGYLTAEYLAAKGLVGESKDSPVFHASKALGAYIRANRGEAAEPVDDVLTDLLTDLRHLADRADIGPEGFAGLVQRSLGHYMAEKRGER